MLPELTAKELLNTIRSRASQSNSPDNQLGYGIPNFTYIITSTDSEKTTNFVSVFPNPAMNQVKIEFLDNLQSDRLQIDLVDSKGAVSIVRILPINSKEFLIDISNQKPGLYLLRCQRGRQHFIRKILKIE